MVRVLQRCLRIPSVRIITISNTEKVIADRLNTHLCNESLTDTFQSAYKRNHSTETALLCVVNEIRTALDRRQGTVIAMIDLSAGV